MYYKVIKNGKVIDVLERLLFVKYQSKNNVMLLCKKSEAQAVIASDGDRLLHTEWMFRFPSECEIKYENVDLEEIDEYEYKQLKALNLKTPEDIIDEYTLLLIDGGIL